MLMASAGSINVWFLVWFGVSQGTQKFVDFFQNPDNIEQASLQQCIELLQSRQLYWMIVFGSHIQDCGS